MLLFLTDVTRILSMLVMYAMFPYFFKYVVHDINGAAPFFGVVNILAFVGASSVPFVTRFLSKRNAYITGNLVLAAGMILAILFSSSVTAICARTVNAHSRMLVAAEILRSVRSLFL